MPEAIIPRSVRTGDTLGVVAPASSIQREAFLAGCAALEALGYKLRYSERVFDRELYFAGTHKQRARELHEMFADDGVAGIVCARGGYGTNHLLPLLDFDLIARKPKALIGYSDITSLLTAIHDRTGLVTFHGPMVAKDFAAADGVDVASWNSALGGVGQWEAGAAPASAMSTLVAGAARGKLYGGCLSMLAASLGTPYEIQTEGCILFMEDIAAKPYQIDRMLMQLKLAGKFEAVRGIIFGEMLDCVQPGGQDYTLNEVLLSVLAELRVPIIAGLSSGHVLRGNITLPIGAEAELVAAEGGPPRLRVLQAATRG